MTSPFEMSDDTPVYVISVAAQLSGMHPQTLRAYDRMGLVSPGRSAGRGRRYSLRDILMLREVQRLSQEDGVNLSGIKRILELEGEVERFRRVIDDMTAQAAQLRAELESTRAVAARLAGLLRTRAHGAELVPVRRPGSPGPVTPPDEEPSAADGTRAALPAAGPGQDTGPDPSPGAARAPGRKPVPGQELSATAARVPAITEPDDLKKPADG